MAAYPERLPINIVPVLCSALGVALKVENVFTEEQAQYFYQRCEAELKDLPPDFYKDPFTKEIKEVTRQSSVFTDQTFIDISYGGAGRTFLNFTPLHYEIREIVKPIVPLIRQWFYNTYQAVYTIKGGFNEQNLIDFLTRPPQYNLVVTNRYQDGNSVIGKHQDPKGSYDEILSCSFGPTRDLAIHPESKAAWDAWPFPQDGKKPKKSFNVEQKPTSLFVMTGAMQENWQHSLPARKGVSIPRYNFTFRTTG